LILIIPFMEKKSNSSIIVAILKMLYFQLNFKINITTIFLITKMRIILKHCFRKGQTFSKKWDM